MIRIEAAYSPAPLTKLIEAKALVKALITEEANVGIRINKNIASMLLRHSLVLAKTPLFYRLTQKGIQIAKETKIIEITISLDQFLKFNTEEDLIKRYLEQKYQQLFKIKISSCFCCGREDEPVEYYLDVDNNEGSYCKKCLDMGYSYAVEGMKKRRANAK